MMYNTYKYVLYVLFVSYINQLFYCLYPNSVSPKEISILYDTFNGQ